MKLGLCDRTLGIAVAGAAKAATLHNRFSMCKKEESKTSPWNKKSFDLDQNSDNMQLYDY